MSDQLQPVEEAVVYRVEVGANVIHFGPEVGDIERVVQGWRDTGATVERYVLTANRDKRIEELEGELEQAHKERRIEVELTDAATECRLAEEKRAESAEQRLEEAVGLLENPQATRSEIIRHLAALETSEQRTEGEPG